MGDGEVGELLGRVGAVSAGGESHAAAGITDPHRDRRRGGLGQVPTLRAARAGTGQIPTRDGRCRVGPIRRGRLQHIQVEERFFHRSDQVRSDVVTATRPGLRRRNASDHQEHTECSGDPAFGHVRDVEVIANGAGEGVTNREPGKRLLGKRSIFKGLLENPTQPKRALHLSCFCSRPLRGRGGGARGHRPRARQARQ